MFYCIANIRTLTKLAKQIALFFMQPTFFSVYIRFYALFSAISRKILTIYRPFQADLFSSFVPETY